MYGKGGREKMVFCGEGCDERKRGREKLHPDRPINRHIDTQIGF